MKRIISVVSPPLLTPAGLLARAAWLAAVWLAADLAGLRVHASIICGTLAGEGAAGAWPCFLGTAYVVLYLLAVLAAPVLVIAAGIFAALGALTARPRPPR